MNLAKHFSVTVLTRANNREAIEADAASASCTNLSFLYHDLSPSVLALKRRGWYLLGVQVYYALWLASLSRRFRNDEALTGFDIVHHLTFNSFEIPPLFLNSTEALKVWGPVGGGQVAAGALLPTLGKTDAFKERCRSLRVVASRINPSVRRCLAGADLVLFANEETRRRLLPACGPRTSVMVDVGVDPARFRPSEGGGSGKSILFAGRFQARKGTRLLLLAFEQALAKDPDLRLRMIGKGDLLAAERRWVEKRGLTDRIDLPGSRTHSEMAEEFSRADIFVFPSLRDTSGAIVLEAMASGIPTICLDHQGARSMVDESTGVRVPVSELSSTIAGLAKAMVELAAEPARRLELGRRARERVMERFSWESKAKQLADQYEALLSEFSN